VVDADTLILAVRLLYIEELPLIDTVDVFDKEAERVCVGDELGDFDGFNETVGVEVVLKVREKNGLVVCVFEISELAVDVPDEVSDLLRMDGVVEGEDVVDLDEVVEGVPVIDRKLAVFLDV
jgi:hypothetical protein